MNRLTTYAIAFSIALGAAGIALADDGVAKSVTGTLEDSYCYGTMGAKGAGHKMCALKCAAKGIPISLVEKGTDKIFVLLPAKNESPMQDDVTHRMEDEVTITGKEYSKGGVNFIVVESVK